MCLNLNLVLFKKVRYFVLGYYYSFTTNVWTKLSTQVEYEVANLFLELCKVKPKLYIYIYSKRTCQMENLPCLCGNNVKK